MTVQQTQSVSASQTATNKEQKESSDDVSLKRLYVYIAVAAGVIGLALYLWRGMHWAAFTPLESEAGRERLRKIIEGTFKQNPVTLMELIHDKLDSPAGHKMIAGYAVAHWQTDEGREQFLAMVVRYLRSQEASAGMTELVAQYADKWAQTREAEKRSDEVGRDVAKRPFHSNSEREELLKKTEIFGLMGNPEAMRRLLRPFIELGSSLASAEEQQPVTNTSEEEKKS
jgi:hypothetical protein